MYVVTPKMKGVYSIAEVVDDSNKKPKQTIFVRLRSDGVGVKFDEAQWRSLGAVALLVEKNGVKVFDNFKSAAIFINSLTVKN